MITETTEAIGSGSWPTIQLDYPVAKQYAGQELTLRIQSGNWSEFDNFRLVTIPATAVAGDFATWISSYDTSSPGLEDRDEIRIALPTDVPRKFIRLKVTQP